MLAQTSDKGACAIENMGVKRKTFKIMIQGVYILFQGRIYPDIHNKKNGYIPRRKRIYSMECARIA